MILAYILLLFSLVVISYYGIGFLLQKWEESQQKKAMRTASQFEEMFIFVQKKTLILLYIGLPLVLGALSYIFTRKVLVVIIFLIVGVLCPLLLVKFMENLRKKRFINQLVDGLMIMNSCLKGGLTLIQAFDVVVEETSAPLSQEISLVSREIKVGVTLEEALLRLDKRMGSEEVTLVTSAIMVARETGGDLTKVFSRLVETIRDRLKLKELVATLTLQTRLQAIIISLIGPVFFFIVRKMDPAHFDIMWQDELGRLLLLIALILQTVGIGLIILFGRVKI
ncbi:MAG: type II secretion system F family protein [Candidatus Omnitrophica bacterium]|jgi:tight adherence protein B|nr:type II secretion system F family protein [Candidatus Omnitrophota bacterium]